MNAALDSAVIGRNYGVIASKSSSDSSMPLRR